MADVKVTDELDGGTPTSEDVFRGYRPSAAGTNSGMKKFIFAFLDAVGNIVGQIRIRTNTYANLISVNFENGELAWSTNNDSDGFRHLFAGDSTTTGGQQIFPPRGDKFSPTNYLWPAKAVNITIGGVDPMPILWMGVDDVISGLYSGGFRMDLVSATYVRCRFGDGSGPTDRQLTLDWQGPIQADSYIENYTDLTGTAHTISVPGRYITTNSSAVTITLDASIQDKASVKIKQRGTGVVTVKTNDGRTIDGVAGTTGKVYGARYAAFEFQAADSNYDVW